MPQAAWTARMLVPLVVAAALAMLPLRLGSARVRLLWVALAALGVAATALRPDPLEPVRHVEAVIAGVGQASHLIGFGAAPILGFGLSVAAWRGSEKSAPKP